jgi:hypothetical protein
MSRPLQSLSPATLVVPDIDYTPPFVLAVNGVCPSPPEVDAGPDQTISGLSGELDGSASSECEKPLESHWEYISGPGTITFGDYTSLSTGFTVSEAGEYVLKLVVSDEDWEVFDRITITAE